MQLKDICHIVPAVRVDYFTEAGERKTIENKLTQKGLLVLRIRPGAVEELKEFITMLVKKPSWQKIAISFFIEIEKKLRSLDQNKLYWALVAILEHVIYQCSGYKDEIHEGLLEIYAPREVNKLTGTEAPKRSHKMTVEEFAYLIQGAFHEIAAAGVPILEAQDIKKYWTEFYKWRWKDGNDLLKFKTIENYREMVNYCEACMTYLEYDNGSYNGTPGNICHIVTDGSGGSSEQENILHLCDTCHISKQHSQGWEEFLEAYPHLIYKVKIAREKEGKKPLTFEAKDDLKKLPEPEEKPDGELDIF